MRRPMCRLRRVIAPSSLSDRHPPGSDCTAGRLRDFTLSYPIRRRAACSTSNEALHTRLLPCLSPSPRSPAQTAEEGEVERTVTSGPLRVKHFPGPPPADSPPRREHRGASLGAALLTLITRTSGKGCEAWRPWREVPSTEGEGPERALALRGTTSDSEVLSPRTGESSGRSAPRSRSHTAAGLSPSTCSLVSWRTGHLRRDEPVLSGTRPMTFILLDR